MYPVEKTIQLYEEALQVLQKRFEGGDVVPEDFWVLKRICKEYLEFLREKNKFEEASRISENTTVLLEAAQTFPPPNLWMEACMVLEMHAIDGTSPEDILNICKRHRKLLKRHPEFKENKNLKRYDRALKNRQDEIKNTLVKPTEN